MFRPENKVDQDSLPQLFEKNEAERKKKCSLDERNMYFLLLLKKKGLRFYYRKLTNCLNRCEQDTIEKAEVMASLREENAGLRLFLILYFSLNLP